MDTILHNFTSGASDGSTPYGSLTLSGAKFYGMTEAGGGNNTGALFSMNTDGSGFGLLHSFTGGASDGRFPRGSLTLSGSKLYGMAASGGRSDTGAIFSMNTDGTDYRLLQIFAAPPPIDGASPKSGDLTLSDDGSTLFGMTSAGGTANVGVVFSLSTTPTPEPASTALLGLGALLLAARRRGV